MRRVWRNKGVCRGHSGGVFAARTNLGEMNTREGVSCTRISRCTRISVKNLGACKHWSCLSNPCRASGAHEGH